MTHQSCETNKASPELPLDHALELIGNGSGDNFDPDDYLEFFDGEEITVEEAREFIQTLWTIIQSFVELGFKTDPVQLILEASQHKEDDQSDLDAKQIRGDGSLGGEG